jgi:hypothetical protein
MAIRSGRFRLQAQASIIYEAGGNFYRIFNSSDPRAIGGSTNLRSFTVRVAPGSSAGATITVAPKFSLDVKVRNSIDELEITPTTIGATGEVEGIYDLLRDASEIRSGRFRFETAPTDRHQIVSSGGGNLEAMYRMFNSGENDITLWDAKTGGTSFLAVPAKQSRDFNVSNRDVFVQSAGAFEGIYDFLTQSE